MPMKHNFEPNGSLDLLLKKCNAVQVVNNEILDFIQSRKDEKIVCASYHILEQKQNNRKRRKIVSDRLPCSENAENELILTLTNRKSVKSVHDIVTSWRYVGRPLKREKNVIQNDINLNLRNFDDLMRLHRDFQDLLKTYSDKLTSQPDPCKGARALLENLEILQVALGDIHKDTLGMKEQCADSDFINSSIQKLTTQLNDLQDHLPEFRLNLSHSQGIPDTPEFQNYSALSCKHSLPGHEYDIEALEVCIVNGKQYLASASFDQTIKLWDLQEKSVICTLRGHKEAIYGLASYQVNGVGMLASASSDKTIKLWNISQKCFVTTLTRHLSGFSSLATFKVADKTFLLGGSFDSSIQIWDLHDQVLIATLESPGFGVNTLCIFHRDGKPYLASGYADGAIRIWCLRDLVLVTTLDFSIQETKQVINTCVEEKIMKDGDKHENKEVDHCFPVNALKAFEFNDRKVLASGHEDGTVNLWNLENHRLIKSLDAHKDAVSSLEVISCNNRSCLVTSSDDYEVNIWDLHNGTKEMYEIGDNSPCAIKALRNEENSYLIIGDDSGTINLWME